MLLVLATMNPQRGAFIAGGPGLHLGCKLAAFLLFVLAPLFLLVTTRTQDLLLVTLDLLETNDGGSTSAVEEQSGDSINAATLADVKGHAEAPASGSDEEFGLEDHDPIDVSSAGIEMVCDFSSHRSDVCAMRGDIRTNANSSSIMFVSKDSISSSSFKIRPYTRKWEASTMAMVKELTVTRPRPEIAPPCDVNHSVPAIVFSTGGFQGNYFHELTDVLVPLFLTSHPFHGEVQFLVVDYKSWWVMKYKSILEHLSRYEIIDLDTDKGTHCYKHVVVGLRSHKVLGINATMVPRGYSMVQFRRFLRDCYSLSREYSMPREKQQPKLVLMSRDRSRSLLNEHQVVKTARGLGYAVVVLRPSITTNLSYVAGEVNSADVMLGVHGSGLSNMVFLPTNATVIQIIPWGRLRWACGYTFGEPAIAMGLRYLDYEVGVEETSLTEKYPRNHTVFTDPAAIFRRGFGALWSVFLNEQNVTVDVSKLGAILSAALRSYHT